MAPNKRKKKPLANPARGFATISLVSKKALEERAEERQDPTDVVPSKTDLEAAPAELAKAARVLSNPSTAETELPTLSPEEFEQQLEQAELQQWVEKHGQSVRRDVARQSARLRTDRRVLRGQAEPLSTRAWLPPAVLNGLLDLIRLDSKSSGASSNADQLAGARKSSEEEMTVQLWALRQILLELDFQEDKVEDVLSHLVTTGSQATKDAPWGLQDALDWLALHLDRDDLPDYEERRALPLRSSLETPSSSGTSTPRTVVSDEPHVDLSTDNMGRYLGPRPSTSLPTSVTPAQVASDDESDLEPEELVSSYLSTKLRLHNLQPDLLSVPSGKRQPPPGPMTAVQQQSSQASPETATLQRKLQRIESDILFDRAEADRQWREKMVELQKENADRRKMGLNASVEPVAPTNLNDSAASAVADESDPSDGDDDLVLGDLFTSLPDVQTDSTTGAMSVVATDSDGMRVAIRDFGKSAGMSPRRALEDVCRARDPKSEAFISTVALFLLFSSSPKEEKVYLRLPSVWRDVWSEFLFLKKEQADREDRTLLERLRAMVRQKRDRDEAEGVVLTNGFRRRSALLGAKGQTDTAQDPEAPASSVQLTSELMQSLWAQKSGTPAYQRMLARIGKSTQVPSFILEHELSSGRSCKVYCTEPRRISAISLARRVSEELGERRNDLGTPRSMVGYAIRLESNVSHDTRLVFATTGIVLRMLERMPDLAEVTHLVLDEVHERSIDSDFLLIVVRKLMLRRPELKVILMSATVDAQRFSTYLDQAPILNVPGRTFAVETRFLEDAVELTGYAANGGGLREERMADADDAEEEIGQDGQGTVGATRSVKDLTRYSEDTRLALSQMDEYRIDYDLVTALIEKVARDESLCQYSSAILVFLPGMAEIRRLNEMLLGHPAFITGWYVYPLHSTIASDEQEQAFLVPPPGIRKIVLATNIAETGITIPDVTCVIDTGRHKEMRFDERRQLSRLIESFISRANAKQRRGRAGRVQEGLCFHLFTRARHDSQMAEQQSPEMLRLSLQDLVLRVKICKLGHIEETLSDALDPPSAKNIRRAIDALVDVKALTAGEDLTPLGAQLAKLPLDVHLGKLVLLGTIFKCVDVALTIAAVLSSKSPFSTPMGARSHAHQTRLGYKKGDSDLLTAWNAYCSWRRVCLTARTSEFQFCKRNFLNQQTLSSIEDLKEQLLVAVLDAGFFSLTEVERADLAKVRASRQRQFFIVPEWINVNSQHHQIVNSVIAWSFYPKLLARDGKGWRNVANNQAVSVHPSSVNKGSGAVKWLSYYHIMQSSNRFYNAHETSAVEAFAVALLCGDAEFKMYAGVIILDGHRLRFSVTDWKIMLAIKMLRTRLRDIMVKTFRSPGKPLTIQQGKWLGLWQKIFSEAFAEQA
ncbi:MAG: hypothetical protein M1838_002940 [Thelocarpon superellum]|nr:MAG: hypothetical protein M1838_002940 [Thelocarpon superellum]